MTGKKSDKKGRVFLVIAIDTEGPCKGRTGHNWNAINGIVSEVMDGGFRNKYKDSDGKGIALSWFIVDWTGFKENPLNREFGYHRIYDYYRQNFLADDKLESLRDGIYCHYHNPPEDGKWRYNFSWSDKAELENIFCRGIIDNGYFPVCFRAGGAFESTEMSNYLEKWIPYDFSNQSPYVSNQYDWMRAPRDWEVYTPSVYDFQKKGRMERIIARSLNVEKGNFIVQEAELAFIEASNGKDVIVSFFTHDYNDMAGFIDKGMKIFLKSAKKYKGVRFYYENAVNAIRKIGGYDEKKELKIEVKIDGKKLTVDITGDMFGNQPFVAVQSGVSAERINYIKYDEKNKTWDYDLKNIRYDAIGIAVNDKTGDNAVVRIS